MKYCIYKINAFLFKLKYLVLILLCFIRRKYKKRNDFSIRVYPEILRCDMVYALNFEYKRGETILGLHLV